MPTASNESRQKMNRMFGNPIDDGGPLSFLFNAGYTEKAGMLLPPSFGHKVTTEEWDCITFLCDEWDYGFDPTMEK